MNDQYKHLDSGELFLVRAERVPADSDNVVLIFMSDFGRNILKNSETWSSDGTFSTVPRDFSQIYVVFGSSHDKLFPCAYMLLPNKSASVYEYALETLKLELQYTPRTINMDFEQAVIKAVKSKMPTTEVGGCNFHWKKNIFSNVGDKGCLSLFNENEFFQVLLDLIYTLCMVPPDDVVYAFESVIEPYHEDNLADHEDYEYVLNFISYVENTYIGKLNRRGERRPPLFPIPIWNIYQSILAQNNTTNNGVESWNGRWNNTIGTNHNLWRIINGFKKEDSLARTKLQEVVAGRYTDPNPSRSGRRSLRQEGLQISLQNYTRATCKEFMFGLRGD